jgi:hypothetical protein
VSRVLGLSSLKPEDVDTVPDWSTLEDKDRKMLEDWHSLCVCSLLLSPLLEESERWEEEDTESHGGGGLAGTGCYQLYSITVCKKTCLCLM